MPFVPDTFSRIGDRLAGTLKYSKGAAKDRLGLSAVLIRPDGVVAWACDDEPDIAEAVQALSQ